MTMLDPMLHTPPAWTPAAWTAHCAACSTCSRFYERPSATVDLHHTTASGERLILEVDRQPRFDVV